MHSLLLVIYVKLLLKISIFCEITSVSETFLYMLWYDFSFEKCSYSSFKSCIFAILLKPQFNLTLYKIHLRVCIKDCFCFLPIAIF
jgi:hypothetical protein